MLISLQIRSWNPPEEKKHEQIDILQGIFCLQEVTRCREKKLGVSFSSAAGPFLLSYHERDTEGKQKELGKEEPKEELEV